MCFGFLLFIGLSECFSGQFYGAYFLAPDRIL